MENEKQYTGYGYHGGGRKKTGRVKLFKTFSVSLSLEDYEIFEQAFLKSGAKNKSRFVFEKCTKTSD